MHVLKTKPDSGVAGKKMTIAGAGLQPNKDVIDRLDDRDRSRWIARRPARQRRLHRPQGRQVRRRARDGDDRRQRLVPRHARRRRTTSAASTTSTPSIDGVQVAKGGFLLDRTVTITPKRGPIGTPITVTFSGLGSRLYESGGASSTTTSTSAPSPANYDARRRDRSAPRGGPGRARTGSSSPAGDHRRLPEHRRSRRMPWATAHRVQLHGHEGRRARRRRALDWPVEGRRRRSMPTTTLSAASVRPPTAAGDVRSSPRPAARPLEGRPVRSRADAERARPALVGRRSSATASTAPARAGSFVAVPLGTATAGADGTARRRT